MASIVLSFVGNQDPFGGKTGEGSLVTLVRSLVENGKKIKAVVLIYTKDTSVGAKETKDWLLDELGIDDDAVKLISASSGLSDDPTDLFEAAQEASKGLDLAQLYIENGDLIELNASSGTPAMKYSFTLLQAAGYVVNGQVWQIRNPEKMNAGQKRVFQTDGAVLRREFNLKAIKRQIEDYNYSGALETMKVSRLENEDVTHLLEYGRCRIVFDFEKANQSIHLISQKVERLLTDEINSLRSKCLDMLCREAYFVGVTKLHNKHYSEFLVFLSAFNENIAIYLAEKESGIRLRSRSEDEQKLVWENIRKASNNKLYRYLQGYKMANNKPLRVDESISRFVAIAIATFYRKDDDELIKLVNTLNNSSYIRNRNDFIHNLQGVSSIPDSQLLVTTMRQILEKGTTLSINQNPYRVLNAEIYSRLGSFGN